MTASLDNDPLHAAPARPERRGFLQRVAAATALGAAGLGAGGPAAAVGGTATGTASGTPFAGSWMTTWAGSSNGVYPDGTAVQQPELKFAFPDPATGASNQSFRLIVRPTVWGRHFRLRFSNVFGTQPVTFADVYLGLQAGAGALVKDSNRRVTFGGAQQVTVAAGQVLWSDPIELDAVRDGQAGLLQGRKLAVSFHVVGTSGPMTWHSKAMQTSYVTNPGAGSRGAEESDAAFVHSTSSWYFLDAVDVAAQPAGGTVVCLGDSITDGTGSTQNGDDRWPDVVARRLYAAYGNRFAVVNAGIGGNRILADSPTGGPSALARLERDVIGLSGVVAVVWFEGTNDVRAGSPASFLIPGIQRGVATLRERIPGVRILQATITTDKGSANNTPEIRARREEVNAFIRSATIFDGVVDFDAATVDPVTGEFRAPYLANSTTGAVDYLHPNRAGYLAMGNIGNLELLTGVPMVTATPLVPATPVAAP